MSGPLRIAIVVPFMNEERHLGDLLASMAAQTRLPDQLVLVDDGSTDGSPAVAHAFANRFAWASVARRPPRRVGVDRLANGAALQAFAWGVERADSGWDVVAKVDADLRLTRRTLETLERLPPRSRAGRRGRVPERAPARRPRATAPPPRPRGRRDQVLSPGVLGRHRSAARPARVGHHRRHPRAARRLAHRELRGPGRRSAPPAADGHPRRSAARVPALGTVRVELRRASAARDGDRGPAVRRPAGRCSAARTTSRAGWPPPSRGRRAPSRRSARTCADDQLRRLRRRLSGRPTRPAAEGGR